MFFFSESQRSKKLTLSDRFLLISVAWIGFLTDRKRVFDEPDNLFQFFGLEDEKASLVNHLVLINKEKCQRCQMHCLHNVCALPALPAYCNAKNLSKDYTLAEFSTIDMSV